VSEHLASADRHLAAGDLVRATAALRDHFTAEPSLAAARAVLTRLDGPSAQPDRAKTRVWVLRSYTIEPIFPLLRAGALLESLDLQLRAGDFNAYAQEILDPGSPLYAFDPQLIILAAQTRDVVPDLYDYAAAAEPATVAERAANALAGLTELLTTLRSRTAASIIVFDFAQPVQLADGVLDEQAPDGQRAMIESLNHGLRAFAAASVGVFVLGFDNVVARVGRERFFDERKWLTARMPFAASSLWPVAQECLRVILPVTGRTRKAVVVDLDNTLWGGVIGEDGIDGIKIGREYPGAAFLALQRALLDLHRRGVILAIASKNDERDALDVLDRHPGNLLRREHFAAHEIGWNPKPESLRRIAAELNIGLDSLVFVDDNPAEREAVRRELPQVLVVELPQDPMQYAASLRALPCLERVRVSSEDRDRGRQYAEQRSRAAYKTSAATLEDYYRSLEMIVEIAPLGDANRARISQLTQKTNQFNLTTRRYDEAALAALAAEDATRVYGCSVRDRFGDNGLVGVVIVRDRSPAFEIDTLLLSCRVIGRTIETAMLSYVATQARRAGARSLRGWFVPTAKNEPAADFYSRHGFEQVEARDGASLWQCDLLRTQIEWPEWLARASECEAA
jgi:FkbH-like protein